MIGVGSQSRVLSEGVMECKVSCDGSRSESQCLSSWVTRFHQKIDRRIGGFPVSMPGIERATGSVSYFLVLWGF